MKVFNKIKGFLGEEKASKFLKKKKYKIIERNFKNSIGEIDIIARIKQTVVFVEVKARESDRFGLPCEAVGHFKQNKIRLVAQSYIKLKRLEKFEIRFDVIEVLDGKINHIENAF